MIKQNLKRILQINDSPQRIALGLALGVFLGVMPGVGVIAGLVLASFLRLNRVATTLGVLITNTWLSLATFLLAIKVGSVIMNLRWQEVYQSWLVLGKNFQPQSLLRASFFNLFLPVALGYLVISAFFSFIAYIATFFLTVYLQKKERIKRCQK